MVRTALAVHAGRTGERIERGRPRSVISQPFEGMMQKPVALDVHALADGEVAATGVLSCLPIRGYHYQNFL